MTFTWQLKFIQFHYMVYPNISDYMYSINVTNYRVAEDDELGLEGKMPTVEIVSK